MVSVLLLLKLLCWTCCCFRCQCWTCCYYCSGYFHSTVSSNTHT